MLLTTKYKLKKYDIEFLLNFIYIFIKNLRVLRPHPNRSHMGTMMILYDAACMNFYNYCVSS